jgi:hypothetical protein
MPFAGFGKERLRAAHSAVESARTIAETVLGQFFSISSGKKQNSQSNNKRSNPQQDTNDAVRPERCDSPI